MLLGQDRGRDKNGNLLCIRYCFECSPYSYLGFSKPNIPAYQTIHGLLSHHILQYIFNGLYLIVCFLMLKGSFEFTVMMVRQRKGVPFSVFSQGVQVYELFCDPFDGFLCLLFGNTPGMAPQTVQFWMCLIRSSIFLQYVYAISRYVKPVIVGIFDQHVIVDLILYFHV